MFMKLDENNRPIDWRETPKEGYIEVADIFKNISKAFPRHIWDGNNLVKPEPLVIAKTREDVIQETITLVQQRLDNFAKTRGYDGILSACTYATSSILKFQQEGQYCVELRDTTWATMYANGDNPTINCFADLEPLLPNPVWPE